jgi:hypothetical protein
MPAIILIPNKNVKKMTTTTTATAAEERIIIIMIVIVIRHRAHTPRTYSPRY